MKTFVFVGMTDVGSELAPNLLEAGFRAAEGIASADVVFTFTPFLEDTEEIFFGSEGLISQAKEGAYLVNLGPATPSLSYEIYALAQVSGMNAVDAPLFVTNISREHAYADPGNLHIFFGGSAQDLEQLKPMLEALAKTIVPCGEVGAGQLAKAAASLQRASAVVNLVESEAFCRIVGAAGQAHAYMDASLAASGASQELLACYQAIVGKQFASSYAADIMLGEVLAALAAADDNNLILPQAEAAEYLLQLLLTVGGQGKAPAALGLLYADEAECERFGLDWSRADDLYQNMDGSYDEDYDDYEDGEDHAHWHGCGHDHSHGHHHHFDDEDSFGFGYSPN